MRKSINLLIFCFTAAALFAQNQPPLITNLTVSPDWANQTLAIAYTVSDAESDPLEITLQFSDDGGKTYDLSASVNSTGDVGFPVQPGNRSISCDLSALNNIAAPFSVRLIADDKQVFDFQSLVNAVDSNRLRADLEFLEGIRHRTTGAAHLEAARDSIRHLFDAAELFHSEQAVPLGNYSGKNLIGHQPGTAQAHQVVVVDAHYDTVNNAPGADDNGSGTVGMMEIARLLSRYPSKKSIRYIGFDLEESGLLGSKKYVQSGIPSGETIEGVFNFEMIGYWSNQPNSQTLPNGFALLFPLQAQAVADNQYRGDFITNVGNSASAPIALLYNNAAQQYVPGLKVITLDVPGTGQQVQDLRRSDHAPFWDAGMKALMLTDGADFRNECYHTPSDTLNEKLNFTFMSNVVKATLAAMAELAEVQHGDWATASFQASVGTWAPRPLCEIFASQMPGQPNGFTLAVNNCAFTDAILELYDMKGALQLQERIDLSPQTNIEVMNPNLAAGTYVLKIRHNEGTWTQKMMLR